MSASVVLSALGRILVAAVLMVTLFDASADAQRRRERITFDPATNSTSISGRIRGYDTDTYMIDLDAGQRVTFTLETDNRGGYFNITEPGASQPAHVGSRDGDRFSTRTRRGGTYSIEIYLMRNAARRDERARYTVTVRAEDAPRRRDSDYFVVSGLRRGDLLNMRSEPRIGSRIVARLDEGVVLQSEGCRQVGALRWCRVRTMDRTPVSGWASAQFLQETRAPRDGFPDRRRRSDDDDDDRGDDRRTGRNPDEPAFLQVDGLARGDLLNLRSEPRVGSQILARLAEGVVLRNEGCRPVGDVSWCRLTTLERDSVTGWASGQFLRASEGPRFGGGTPRPDFREPPRNPDFADGLSGEPDFWEVRGLSRGDTLNVRLAPDGNSRVIARLNEGVVLRNQGCRMNGPTRWCRVETVQGVEVSGWVSGQYLREGRAPR